MFLSLASKLILSGLVVVGSAVGATYASRALNDSDGLPGLRKVSAGQDVSVSGMGAARWLNMDVNDDGDKNYWAARASEIKSGSVRFDYVTPSDLSMMKTSSFSDVTDEAIRKLKQGCKKFKEKLERSANYNPNNVDKSARFCTESVG